MEQLRINTGKILMASMGEQREKMSCVDTNEKGVLSFPWAVMQVHMLYRSSKHSIIVQVLSLISVWEHVSVVKIYMSIKA